jgi:iron complex transport system permease protein
MIVRDTKKPGLLIGIGMGIVCLLVLLLSLSLGQFPISVSHVLQGIFLQDGGTAAIEEQAVLWNIRMPRTVVGFLVGGGLAVSGTIMQAVFMNPLADPAILGVSSGASFGAVLAIFSGSVVLGTVYMPLFAIVGAMLAVSLTVLLSIRHGRINVMPLLLAGIVVGMICNALTSGLLTLGTNQQLHQYLFWTIGGLDYRSWAHVYIAAGPIIGCICITGMLSRHLNILVLGDVEAQALGMRVLPFRLGVLTLASLLTAISVCVSGNIGFVGLVMPHMMRFIVGSDHRRLIPAAALAGGVFLVFCDTLGRIIIPQTEIRAGIMTALLGTPYFLYILHTRLR